MARDYQIVAFARVTRIDDQITKAGVDGDHLRGDDHQPCDPEGNSQADKNLRKSGGKDHPGKDLRRR